MPPVSSKQKHYMQLAYAMSHGHKIKGLRKGTMEKLHETAASMSESSLKDYATGAVKKKKKKGS